MARLGYVGGQWVAQPAQKLCSAQREQGEERKPTLKMKPHRGRKHFSKVYPYIYHLLLFSL